MDNLLTKPVGDFDSHIVKRAREFALAHVAPHAETWELERAYPKETLKEAIREFAGLVISPELGGQGASLRTFMMVLEEFARVDIGFTIPFVVQCNLSYMISQSSIESLKRKHLPLLLSGGKIGSFALTEPQAGSDAAAIDTFAEKTGEKYAISGTKSWVVSAEAADIVAVFAKLESGGDSGDIAVFLVETNRAGIERKQRLDIISGNVAAPGLLRFERMPANEAEILFPAGAGFKAALGALDIARLGIASICNGALANALETAILYAGDRKIFGESVLDKQGIQWAFSDHLSALEASRALLCQTIARYESGTGDRVTSAHAKKVANKAVFEGIGWAMRAMGAAGTMRANNLARQFGAAQLLFNTDGTPEVMNTVISRHVLNWAREAARNPDYTGHRPGKVSES